MNKLEKKKKIKALLQAKKRTEKRLVKIEVALKEEKENEEA